MCRAVPCHAVIRGCMLCVKGGIGTGVRPGPDPVQDHAAETAADARWKNQGGGVSAAKQGKVSC